MVEVDQNPPCSKCHTEPFGDRAKLVGLSVVSSCTRVRLPPAPPICRKSVKNAEKSSSAAELAESIVQDRVVRLARLVPKVCVGKVVEGQFKKGT